jgi:folylpolyglutamate synthase/dihydropteroate synthase
MVKIILSHYKHLKVLLYEFQHPKAVDRKKLEQISEEFGLEVTDDKNLFQKIDTSFKQKVLVTGSNYFLGEFIKSHHCTSIK